MKTQAQSRDIRLAIHTLIEAALAWAEQDYGDVGELEADAALNDAVREFKRMADRLESPPLDVLFHPLVS